MTAIAATIALVLVILIALPLLFGDRITQRVKVVVNQNVDAHVDWRDAGLSMLKNFPHLTLTLDNLTVVGTGHFENDTLAAVRHLGVVLDLTSALANVMSGKPLTIRAIEIDQPRLTLIALEDGSANWDIAKKPAAPGGAGDFEAVRRSASAASRSATLPWRSTIASRSSRQSIRGFNETLSGDFSQSQVAIVTHAHADTATVTFAANPYLNHVALGLDADVQADLANKRYTLKKTELSLNDLKLAVSGSAATSGKDLALDLAFNAPSTSFHSILSLVPAIYAHDFAKVKTTGSFTVNGKVKGDVRCQRISAFAINTKVNDATFQYPDPPASRALDLRRSLARQPGRERRQHRREARPLPRRARPESDRRASRCSARRSPIRTSMRASTERSISRTCAAPSSSRGSISSRAPSLPMRPCARASRTSASSSTRRSA